MSAQSDHIEAMNRMARLASLAEALAPAFRDKFDFSEPKHFEAWADLAFKGAEALFAKQEALLAAEKKVFDDAKLAEVKAQDLAKFEKQKEVEAASG